MMTRRIIINIYDDAVTTTREGIYTHILLLGVIVEVGVAYMYG